ncbi:MAG: glycosyl hydrolase family 18 protein [Gemmatimonadaceae bacterium]
MPRFAILFAAILLAPAVRAQGAAERLFYHVDNEDSYERLVKHIGQITIVAPTGYTVDSLGVVWGQIDRRVLELAKRHNVRVMPLVTNEAFHQPSLKRLLGDTVARARATATLAEVCRRNGYWGIQFDIENVSVQDRDPLTAWYAATARALREAGCRISIAVVHRPGEEPGPLAYHRFLYDSWRGGYDLAALAKAGDFVTVMSYSQHTRRTPPGPSAGLPWMRAVVDYCLRFMPPEKLSLGIPLQSMRWYTREDASLPERARSWSEPVSWAWGQGLAERNGAKLQWDAEQAVTYGFYSNGGTFEWLFVEDVQSFRAKLALAKEKKLRGFSAWVLGPEDERIWDVLRDDRASSGR